MACGRAMGKIMSYKSLILPKAYQYYLKRIRVRNTLLICIGALRDAGHLKFSLTDFVLDRVLIWCVRNLEIFIGALKIVT